LSFKGSVEEVRRAGEAASRIVEDLGRISSVSAASVERQERLSQALATGFESAVAALKAHNDGLASELERSRRMTGETGEALAGLAESITRRVGEMRVLSFERPNGAAK
jgi:phage-related tail protein